MGQPTIAKDPGPRDPVLRRIVDFVFGYDFFISYSQQDGLGYPFELKARLESAGFKAFLDRSEYVAGIDLRNETRRHVTKSAKVVVVGRPAAFKAPWVRREVDIALAHRKIPILINVNRAFELAPSDAALAIMAREQDWLRIEEQIESTDAVPSDHAVAELIRSFGATRQEAKRQRIFGVAALVFGITASIAIWQAVAATKAKNEAVQGRSNMLAAISDQYFRIGDYGTALALGVAALPDYLAENAMPAEKAAVKAAFNAYSNLVEVKSLEKADDRSLYAMYHPNGRQYVVWSKGDRKIAFKDLDSGSTLFSIPCFSCAPDKDSFSGDGSLFVSERGSEESRIVALYDANKGNLIRQFSGHKDWIDSVSLSRNGRRVVTTSNDKTAKIWNVDGSEIANISLTYKMKKYAGFISDDGASLAVLTDFDLALYKVEKAAKAFFNTRVSSPPESVLLKSDKSRIFVVAGADVTELLSRNTDTVTKYSGSAPARVVDFDAKTTRIAVGYRDGSISIFFESQPSRTRRVFPDPGSYSVRNLVFSPDGTQIAASASNRIILVRASDLSTIALAVGHDDDVQSLSFSPDGKFLLSSSADGTVRIWRTKQPDAEVTSALMRREKLESRAKLFSPQPMGTNPVLARSIGGTVSIGLTENGRFWIGKSRSESCILGKPNLWISPPLADISPYGDVAIFSESDDVSVGALFRVIKAGGCEVANEIKFPHGFDFDPSAAKALSYDGKHALIASSAFNDVAVADLLQQKKITELRGHTAPIVDAVFSPDRSIMATYSTGDNTVRLWSTLGWENIGELTAGGISFLSFSEDGQWLVGLSESGKIMKSWKLFSRPEQLAMEARKALPRQLSPQLKQRYGLQ